MQEHQKQNILVLGGGGFIGRHIIDLIVPLHNRITVLDPYIPENASKDCVWVKGTAQDEHIYEELLKNHEVVIDLADGGKPGASMMCFSDEVSIGLKNCVTSAEKAKQAGVKKYILASSGGTVYGSHTIMPLKELETPCNPINAYGMRKLAFEHYLRMMSEQGGFQPISLRIANPYGEGQIAKGQGFIAAALHNLKENKPISIWGNGETIRDFVHINDVAQSFEKAIAYRGSLSVFNIGSGIGYSLNKIITSINEVTGKKLIVNYEPMRSVDVPANVLDISLAQKELNWQPMLDLDDGLKRTVRWWGI